eukprot:PhM_4_TR5134/c0_g1_i1/m.35263
MDPSSSPWLQTVALSAYQESPARLFLFPFAGGNPKDFMIDTFGSIKADSYVLCLPGRARRMKEGNVSDCSELAKEIAEALHPFLDVPFAFLGYSMGALVAFEVSRLLQVKYGKMPQVLFVVADEAPQTQRAFIDTTLDDTRFVEELRKLELTTGDILDNAEMLNMVLPSIRADMRIENEYLYTAEPKLRCPIVAVCGTKDRWVNEKNMKAWGSNTEATYEYNAIDGGDHIFLDKPECVAGMRAVVARWLKATVAPRLPRGDEEKVQLDRVQDCAEAKMIGNVWVKWDRARDCPKKKPSNNSQLDQGLGAYLEDVRERLELFGYAF